MTKPTGRRTGPEYVTGRFATREQLVDYVVAQHSTGTVTQTAIAADARVSLTLVNNIVQQARARAACESPAIHFLRTTHSRRRYEC